MNNLGNSFNKKTFAYKGAKRVWREIRHVFPGGGTIASTSGFTGIIPAGTPATIAANVITPLATVGEGVKIDGFTQEDVVIESGAVLTATVVYDGEIYAYAMDQSQLAAIKAAAPATIKFVE